MRSARRISPPRRSLFANGVPNLRRCWYIGVLGGITDWSERPRSARRVGALACLLFWETRRDGLLRIGRPRKNGASLRLGQRREAPRAEFIEL